MVTLYHIAVLVVDILKIGKVFKKMLENIFDVSTKKVYYYYYCIYKEKKGEKGEKDGIVVLRYFFVLDSVFKLAVILVIYFSYVSPSIYQNHF